MKITSKEVKTFYRIEFDAADFANAVERYGDSELLDSRFPKAFEGFDINTNSEESCVSAMRRMSVFGNGDTAGYLADYFGFDGWSNGGYFCEKTLTYRMSVFNYGDCIN